MTDAGTTAMPPALIEAQEMIREECREVERILLAKNMAYGNPALQPVRT